MHLVERFNAMFGFKSTSRIIVKRFGCVIKVFGVFVTLLKNTILFDKPLGDARRVIW